MKGIIIRLSVICSLALSAFAAHAGVIYSVTTDAILNNDGLGAWGGDLNVGQSQDLNLTINYKFNYTPRINIPDCDDDPDCLANPPQPDSARFSLAGFQVFDNTNGLASDFIFGSGSLDIRYDGLDDMFVSAGFGSPAGGSMSLFNFTGEFGDLGDPLPAGQAFDQLVESGGIGTLILRAGSVSGSGAGSAWRNNVNGLNGGPPLAPGSFTFYSEAPVPGTLLLLGLGLAGLGWSRRSVA